MNTYMLKGKIHESGLTQTKVAELIGVSESRFSQKINGTDGATFTVEEAKAMKQLLHLTAEEIDSIFFV